MTICLDQGWDEHFGAGDELMFHVLLSAVIGFLATAATRMGIVYLSSLACLEGRRDSQVITTVMSTWVWRSRTLFNCRDPAIWVRANSNSIKKDFLPGAGLKYCILDICTEHQCPLDTSLRKTRISNAFLCDERWPLALPLSCYPNLNSLTSLAPLPPADV